MSRRVLRGFSAEAFMRARRANHLSRGELARLADISPGAVSAWETERATPQADTLARVTSILGIGIDDVVHIEPEKRSLGDLRIYAGMTQSQLANMVGISTTSIAALERGESRLRPDTAKAIAKALRLPAREVTAAYDRARARPAHAAP
jgi:transcriptional regulator with XRE-family HTH domain